MELGWPLPRRREYLENLSKEKTDRTFPVPFQGRMQDFAIHNIPLDFPLYRLENGRTTDRQAEFLAKHQDLENDFFRSDTERADAQQAQHDILCKLAAERKNLYREFEKEPQTEPVILSHNGYIVNGNRRVATWRDLYSKDPKRYERFVSLEAVVLPFCDEKDLDRLEADLQLKEDLKAVYSWTAKALMIREKQESNRYKEAELSAMYEMKKKEMAELLDCLDYADSYLESRGERKRYSLVDQNQFAFRAVSRTRPKMKASETHKEIFERAAFCLIDEAEEGERIYGEIPKVGEHIEEVVDNLLAELEIDTDQKADDDILIDLSDSLLVPPNFDSARLAIRETIEAQAARKKQKKRIDFAASQIAKAKQCLEDAHNAADSRSARKGATKDLERILELVEALQEWAKADGE